MSFRERLARRRQEDPSSEALVATIAAKDPMLGEVVKEARAAGFTWLAIIQLMIQFGPQVMELIRAILEGLRDNAPEPTPPIVSQTQPKAAGK